MFYNQQRNKEWHDVDRINGTHYLLANMTNDSIDIVNVSSDEVIWSWSVRQINDPQTSGGPYPTDWVHLNDVELLPDGRIMASLRNLDKVVFIDPGEGVEQSWTLGKDDNHSILFEQHNPDYIPEERGGPAVLVADSENNRIVEYQRRDDRWVQSWVYSSSKMQWPRDADRLPNGNTLIADTHTNRVFELTPRGDIVWTFEIERPYEAERLGTGDESAGGRSAEAIGYESTTGDTGAANTVKSVFKAVFPSKAVNGLLNVSPWWVTPTSAIALLTGIVATLGLLL